MTKKIALLLATFLLPGMMASATTRTVNSQDDLLRAIGDSDIDTVVLGSDIKTTQKINITRNMYIDGAGHTIEYVGTFGESQSSDKTVWGGIYVLHIYKSTATIKDIKLTGGNAGLLLNGSLVTFLGNVDVSGNGFGGIELGQGAGVTEVPKLSLKDGAKITNTTESESSPTLWVPEDTTKGVLEVNGVEKDVKPNVELSMEEFNEMFGITEENPNTSDNIVIYLAMGFMASIGIAYVVSKASKKDF